MNGRTAASMSLGFLFIAAPEWLAAAVGAGWYPMHYPTAMIAAWLGLGVIGLFIVGILTVRNDDSLDGALFLGWAAFFLGWLLNYLWSGGGQREMAGLEAWYLLFWGIYALFLWLAAMGGGLVRTLFLFTQWIALVLIAASLWTRAGMVGTVGNYVGLVSALLALYQAVGTIVNYSQGRVLLHGCGFVEEVEL